MDVDHIFRFSPASMRLVANGTAYTALGTLDNKGILRQNKPDDFLGKLSEAARAPGGPARSIVYTAGKLTLERGAAGAREASR